MKKLSFIVMACLMVLGLTQCKKNEPSTNDNADNGDRVEITLKLQNGGGEKAHPEESGTIANVIYDNGDVVYVGSGGKYMGYLTYNGNSGLFTGSINTAATEGEPLQFIFMGGQDVTASLTENQTEQYTFSLSNQSTSFGVVSCAASNESFSTTNQNYTAYLRNKCALVKFDLGQVNTNDVITLTGVKNELVINFVGTVTTNNNTGTVDTYGTGTTRYAVLPDDQVEVTEGTISADNYTGTFSIPTAAYTNAFLTDATMSLTAAPSIPTGAINGLFKVSATQQVYFSKGNLQYIGSASTPYWKFADNQWDYLGTTTGQNSTNQNVDRDLFGWGTWTGSATNPANTSSNDSDYSWDNSDFIQTLSNGSGTWRTLTKDEWVYLFNTRASGATVTTTSGTTNDARYTQATINTDGTGVNGIILFPDGVTIASGEATSWGNINSSSQWTEATKCTAAQWTDLADKGCVFLPAAGYRTNASVFNLDTHGYYWSSTYHSPSTNEKQAWQLIFYKNCVQPEYGVDRHYGRSVRLVQDN